MNSQRTLVFARKNEAGRGVFKTVMVGRNENEDRRWAANAALFKQWPPLFACNYQTGDLTLATLHLYNTGPAAPFVTLPSRSVAHRFNSFRSVLEEPP